MKEEYKSKLRQNRASVENAKKSAPSLIDRHNKQIATTLAHTNALNKLAKTVGGVVERHQGSSEDDDDIFTHDEKYKIKASDGDYDYKNCE